MPNSQHQSQLSINTKIDALTARMNKLQNQNRSLKLEVKDLRFQIDTLKNHKLNPSATSNLKTNYTGSTHSNIQKIVRTSQKIQSNNMPLQRVDQKKKQLIKPVRTVLAPSSNNHNTSFNSNYTTKQPETKISKIYNIIDKSIKTQQSKTLSTPTNKTQPRKTITNSSSASNLQKAFGQPKKSFEFYSFMSSMKDDEKVVNIEKLEPSYQNSPSRIEKIDSSLIIEEVENDGEYEREAQLVRGYGSVRRQAAVKKNNTLAYL